MTSQAHLRKGWRMNSEIQCDNILESRMIIQAGDITQLLHLGRQGDRVAENRWCELVLQELQSLAQYLLKREHQGHSLETSHRVNQILIKMFRAKHRDWLGLTGESAETMGWTLHTTQRRWRDARNWLFEHLELTRAGTSAGR